jgi:integrase
MGKKSNPDGATPSIHEQLVELLSRLGDRAIAEKEARHIVRLRVEDFHYHPVRPKLMMPKSAKGGGRNRSQKRHERYSVPITPALAVKLREAASGRNDDAPLLLQSDGSPWGSNPGQRYHRQVDNIVTAIGLDPAEVTVYALRHSSIVRMLLQNVPIRVVASLHSSVAMIERTYSKYITEHSDDISRRALLQHEELQAIVADNVVALAS